MEGNARDIRLYAGNSNRELAEAIASTSEAVRLEQHCGDKDPRQQADSRFPSPGMHAPHRPNTHRLKRRQPRLWRGNSNLP